MLFLFLSFPEQIGQEILSNLHTDREKIQRSRERVSIFMYKLKQSTKAKWLHGTALVSTNLLKKQKKKKSVKHYKSHTILEDMSALGDGQGGGSCLPLSLSLTVH